MSDAKFVHLHNHTHYSLLDGLQKMQPMVDRVRELGMGAVAITDHGTMSGAIEFYKTSLAAGVKPIIGMETYIAARSHTDKEPGKDKLNYHLILLAANNTGYKNLMRLSTIANLEGYYYRPRIDRELLEKYNEGLIVLSGCIGGEVGDALRRGQYQQAKSTAEWYKRVFGDRYYLEMQDHGHPDHPNPWQEQVAVNKRIMKLADELDIQPVVTCDAHYLTSEDQEAHEILLCVQTGAFLDEENRMSLRDFDLFVEDPVTIESRWRDLCKRAVENTKVIADRCNVELELGKILIPKFPLPKGVTEKTFLDEQVYKGLAERYGEAKAAAAQALTVSQAKKTLPKQIRERADYELQVIDQMGFNGYFLIIADFMNWGKSKGIVFGPGRGSAAGSIIAYALHITELDPIEHDLLFERFLNPDRISMPDIDIDIQDTRRDEVIAYCIDKYGADRVANIVTFGTMAARNAVRDVSRVLRVPYAEADRMAKMIPPPIQGRHIPLATSIKENRDLANEYENNATAREVFDLAMRLEGTIRSHGVHAAGVVIAPDDIVNFTPLEKAQKGVIATQYSMGPIEELGLLKMDFLGLSNLTIINNSLRIIRKVFGKSVEIDEIPLDDKKTYELLQRGDTTGVFQFESSGMKRYLRELHPTGFDDIIAMGALYRPGPLTAGLTDSFIKRKNGLEDIEYPHPSFQQTLEATFGVLVFQEQVMRISRDVCGFTGGEADTLRKAMGKKKRDVMIKMKKQFIEGGETHGGVPRAVMEKFWEDLMGFADYAFNKSHSACYGLISYQTAYLKANYPAAFMAALMTSDYDDTERLSIEMAECQNMGIDVLPPDVNESFVEFAVVPGKNQIRFALSAIKNVGVGAVEEILKARESGPFTSLEDFFNRISPHAVNRKTIESLIKTGAFDRFESRSRLLNNIDSLLQFAQKKQKERDSGQTDLFGNLIESSTSSEIQLGQEDTIYTTADYLQWERELMGLYLSDHPLSGYVKFLEEKTHNISSINKSHDGKRAKVGGIVSGIRTIQTKKGDNMAFVRLTDTGGEIELLLFPGVYEQTAWLWQLDKVVYVEGSVNAKNREGQLVDDVKINVSTARELQLSEAQAYKPTGKSIKTLEELKTKKTVAAQLSQPAKAEVAERIYIRLDNTDDSQKLTLLKEHIDANPGGSEVVLVVGAAEARQAIRIPDRTSKEDGSIEGLVSLFGAENVKLV